jgi:hypothetical protein
MFFGLGFVVMFVGLSERGEEFGQQEGKVPFPTAMENGMVFWLRDGWMEIISLSNFLLTD